MRPDRLLLQDILEAADAVIESIPSTRAEFDADKYRAAYVLRQIQIIGEASWRLDRAMKDRHPEIPWSQIAGMRHALVHDYFEVNWNRVYETGRTDVPVLKPQIEAILASLPPGDLE